VTGLSWEVNEEDLSQHFSSVGPVIKCTVLRKPHRGEIVSMGRGIIDYGSVEDAERAITVMDGSVFRSRTIHCRRDRKPLIPVEGKTEEDDMIEIGEPEGK
jgi:RNA recognition motif-containing protein